MSADRPTKKQPKIRIESDLELLKRNKLLAGVLLIQLLACFFASQLQQTDDRPELTWFFTRHIVWAILFAQLINIGFFVAMFPASFVFRMSLVTGWTITAIWLFVLGDNVGRRPGILNEFLQSHISSLPLVLIGWATPFFIARGFMQWQLSSTYDDARTQKISILSLVFATTVAAAAMKFLTLGEEPFLKTGVAMALIGSGIGFSMAIPITHLIMKSKHFLLALIQLELFVGLIFILVILLIDWFDPKFDLKRMGGGWAFISTVILVYGAFLVAIRGLGCSLVIGKPNSE